MPDPERKREYKVAAIVTMVALAFGYGANAIIGAGAQTAPPSQSIQAPTTNGGKFLAKVCSNSLNLTKTGTLKDDAFTEVSGITASRSKPGDYWVHNDSGDTARIFSIRRDGTRVGTFNLTGANAIDWEDIDTGPGPVAGKNYLYIADTGDNDLKRNAVTIYRVAEPNPEANGATATISGVETLRLTYPDGPHNVEAVFIDQVTGEIYAIEKSDEHSATIYKAPAKLADNSSTQFTRVSSVAYKVNGKYQKVTGADMAPDNSAIVIRTYERVIAYNHQNANLVTDLSAGNACLVPAYSESHAEAVAFQADSSGLVTTSEGKKQPIYSIDAR